MEAPIPPRAVVLEAYGAHAECLDFQVNALLRAGLAVEVWTCRANPWRPADVRVRRVVLDEPVCLAAAWRLWRVRPALLVINTATGPVVRDLLCLIRPLGLPTVGIFHDVAKLRAQFSSRLIARLVDARLLLARHLALAAAEAMPLAFNHVHLLAEHIPARAEGREVVVAVPGVISHDKKDLEGLLAAARHPALDRRIRFLLLGRLDGSAETASWWCRCRAAGATERIAGFTRFVPQTEFLAHLARSAAVLPLIHPGCGHYARFCADKISGAVNLALGARLPLLVHEDLARHWGFGPTVATYGGTDGLVTTLNQVADPAWRAHRHTAILGSEDVQPLSQQARYLTACAAAVELARRGRTAGVRTTVPARRARPPLRTHFPLAPLASPVPATH